MPNETENNTVGFVCPCCSCNLVVVEKKKDSVNDNNENPSNGFVKPSDTWVSENFQWSETQSKDGAETPVELIPSIVQQANYMEIIREAGGNKPLVVKSWYRSPSHNASKDVKGKPNSKHLEGIATDFYIIGMLHKQVYDIVQSLIDLKKIPEGGLSLYSWGVHYDSRGYKGRW